MNIYDERDIHQTQRKANASRMYDLLSRGIIPENVANEFKSADENNALINPVVQNNNISAQDGLIDSAGNIDLRNRPQVQMPDGSTATVRSMSFNEDGQEVLIPTISTEGREMTEEEAIAEYRRTGQHLGKFSTIEEANAAAKRIHDSEELRLKQNTPVEMQYEEMDDAKSLNEAARIATNYNAERIRKGQEMAEALGLPSKLVMHNMETYQKAEEMYSFMQRMKLPDNSELEKYFPGIDRIAQTNPALAAEALVNLENVKVAHGIEESFGVGWNAGTLQRERSLLGTKAFGGGLTAGDKARLKELEEQMQNEKQAPEIGDSFLDAMMYGVASNANMMANWAFNEMTALMTVGGAIIGGAAKQDPTGKLLAAGSTIAANIARGALSKAGLAGAAAGMQAGTAANMFRERVGDYYLNFLEYQDGNGNQLLSDNEARLYAALSAGLEAGIEFLNINAWTKLLGGGQNKAALGIIKEMIAGSRDTTSFRLLAKTMLEKAQQGVKATWSEILEEGVQQGTSDIITNIAAARNPGGNIPSYSAGEIFARGAESMIEALPASAGFTLAGTGASSFRGVNNIANAVFRAGSIRASVQRTAKANNCINELAENPQVQEFIKNNPQAAEATIGAQLEENDMGTAYIDTELLNQTDDGKKVFNQLVETLGYSEEEIANVKGTNTNLALPTKKLLLLDGQTRASLQDYISFKEADACFKRNKEIVEAIMKTQAKNVQRDVERIEQGVDAAINENFTDEEERFYAKDIILNNINLKPAEALAEERRQTLAELDSILSPVENMLRSGMGNGVEIIIQRDETGELIGDNSMRGIRASNNAPWYQNWWKDNGRRPNKAELRDIAIANITAQNTPYLLESYMGMAAMEFEDPDAWQDVLSLRERINGLQDRLEMLDRLQEGMKNISLDEISAGEALSPEGIKAYRSIVAAARNADVKKVRQAAMMNAMVMCHHADAVVDLMRRSGYREYTVADYFKQNPVVLKFGANENATWDSRKIYGQTQVASVGGEKQFNMPLNEDDRKIIKVDGEDTFAEITEEFEVDGVTFPAAPISLYIGYEVENSNTNEHIAGFGLAHILHKHGKALRNRGYQKDGKPDIGSALHDILSNYDGVQVENGSTKKIRLAKQTADNKGLLLVLDYDEEKKMYSVETLYTLKGGQLRRFLDKKIDLPLSEHPTSQPQHPAAVVLPEPAKVEAGINGGPSVDRTSDKPSFGYILSYDEEEVKSKVFYKTQAELEADRNAQEDRSFEQVAYHGTPHLFDEFSLDHIGSGEGAQAHGWGLYFAQNKSTAYGYRNALSRNVLELTDNDGNKVDMDNAIRKAFNNSGDEAGSLLEQFRDSIIPIFEEGIPKEEVYNTLNDAIEDADFMAKDKEREMNLLIESKGSQLDVDYAYRDIVGYTYLKEFLTNIKEIDYKKSTPTVFEVDIPESDVLLDEQKRYSEQPESVRKALSKLSKEMKGFGSLAEAINKDATGYELYKTAGKDAFYEANEYEGGSTKEAIAASRTLNKYGIKGITYDGQHDGRCFVVFDDKAIAVIERYNQSAGVRALTADTSAFLRAERMKDAGASMKEIYKETGWTLGADGRWRFEIPDNLDKINISKLPNEAGEVAKLGDIYDNEKLYEAYPWLRSIEVAGKDIKGYSGMAYDRRIELNIRDNWEWKEYHIELDGKTYIANGSEYIRAIVDENGKSLESGAEKAIIETYLQAKENNVPVEEAHNQRVKKNEEILANPPQIKSQEIQKKILESRKAALEDLEASRKYLGKISIKRTYNEKKKAEKHFAETLVHEIQHLIQRHEYFARGGNPESVKRVLINRRNELTDEVMKYSPEVRDWGALYYTAEEEFFKDNVDEERIKMLFDEAGKIAEDANISEGVQNKYLNLLRDIDKFEKAINEKTDEENYKNLYGEQEARMAADKARLRRDIDRLKAEGKDTADLEERLEYWNVYGPRTTGSLIVFGNNVVGGISRSQANASASAHVAGTTTLVRGVRTIELFKAADQSTFLHEAAHLFFDDLERLYNTAGISKQVRQDWEKLNAWAAWNENALKEYEGTAVHREFKALDEAIRKAKTDGGAELGGVWLPNDMLLERWKQERFARSFEQYMKDGEAPTKTLRAMFRKFANWLTSIYRHYTSIGAAPTQEVKEIMDRMLATQEAIDEAVVMADIDAIEKAGGLQYLDYSSRQMWQKIYGEAKDKAYDTVLKYAMQDLREADKTEYQKKLDEQREYITVKLSKLPAYMVQKALQLNPRLTISDAFAAMNTTEAEYKKQIAEYGRTLDAAVAHYMKNYEQELKNEALSKLSLRERAEEAMANNYYRELLTAYELEVMQRRIKREQNLTKKLAKLSGAEHSLRRKEIEKRARELAFKDAIRDVKGELKRKRISDNTEDRTYIRDILAQHPAYKAAALLEENPNMSIADAVAAFDITEEEYTDVMKRLGTSVEKAVEKWIENANKVARESFTPDEAQIKAMAVVKLREEEYQLRIADYENELADAPVQTSIDKVVANLDARRKEKTFIERGVRVLRDAAAGQVEAIRKSALKKLDSLPAKYSTNPATWMKLSSEQSQKAIACLAKKDFVGAVKAKQLQLAYDIMAAEAYKNKEKYESFTALLKARSERLRSSKDLAAEERYLYGHVLYVFGIINKDYPLPQVKQYSNPREVLESFMATNKEVLSGVFVNEESGGYNLPADIIDAVFGRAQVDGGVKSLTLPDMQELKKLMACIYKLGREHGKLRTLTDADGKPIRLEDEMVNMSLEIGRKRNPKNSDQTGAETMTDIEKAMNTANKARVSLLKIETILDLAGKRFHELIYTPVKRAFDNKARMELELQDNLKNMWDTYWQEKAIDGNVSKTQKDFYGKKVYELGTSKLTHENVIALAANWGTELNRRRILEGYNVQARDIVALLQNLDDADWKLVETIWATFDYYWPMLRDVQERTTGVVMEKQEAVRFSILDKNGKAHTLRGGYYPIKYNANRSTQLATFEANETARMSSGDFNTRSGLRMGSTKARFEGNVGNKKVLLDLSEMNKTLADNIHAIAMRETLRDVNMIMNNETFQNIIRTYFGQNTMLALNKWLADCWASEPRSKSGIEMLAARLRSGSTVAALALNVNVALLNICNFFPYIHYLGRTKGIAALKSFCQTPTAQYEFALSKSVFLKTRENSVDVNVATKESKETMLKPVRKLVAGWGFTWAAWTDRILMIPLWTAEYQQAYQDLMQENVLAELETEERAKRMEEMGVDEATFEAEHPRKHKKRSLEEIDKAAIDAGDKAVRKVFGSARTLDLADVQRSQSEFEKLFTMFYSYFSVVHNATETALGEFAERRKQHKGMGAVQFVKDVLPLMSYAMFWYMLPAAMETLIREASRKGEDKEPEDYGVEYLSTLFGQMVGGVPVLRDALPYLLSSVTGTDNYGMRNTSISEAVTNINRLVRSIRSDKKDGFDVLKQSMRTINPTIGMPRMITDGFVTTLEFIDHGEMSIEDLQHYVWSVMFAKDFDKNR